MSLNVATNMTASLADLMQMLSITRYPVGSRHWVNVTHITDPGNFYVRPTAYRDYLPTLKQYQGPVDPSKLQIGSIVVFKSETTKDHVRGQIQNIKTENETTLYDLFALDYGFTELSVSGNDLKKPLEAFPMPSLVLHCQLGDCRPKGREFDQHAIETMIFYVGKERAKMIIHGKIADQYIVHLVNTCPEDIATMMALTNYTCLSYATNAISRMSTVNQPNMYYTYKEVKVGDTLNVRLQSGDSLKSFYVCEIQDHQKHIKEQQYMKPYYYKEKDFSPENLKRGNALAVFCSRYLWYERALITDVVIPEKKAVVQLVDLGTKTDICMDTTRLKTMSSESYFVKPAMSIYCQVDEKQVWDNELHRFLYPGHEFVITVEKVGYQFVSPNTVTISNAAQK